MGERAFGELVDLDSVSVWKVGAGDGSRNHADLLRQFDLFAAGPAEPGPYHAGKPYMNEGREERQIRDFYEAVQPRDVFIMRVGVWTVEGVGIVEDEPASLDEAWGDVDGWDIRHTRRVRWIHGPTQVLGREGFGAQGATLSRVTDQRLLTKLATLPVDPEAFDRPLRQRPAAGKPLSIEQLCDEMIEQGLGLAAAEEWRSVLQRTERLVKWYKESNLVGDNAVSEEETLSYIAVPLLHAIGWTHQLLAIEWEGVDAALFAELPREKSHVKVIVEAKSLGSGLRGAAAAQAEGYVDDKGLSNCRTIFVTDGPRWVVRRRDPSGDWKMSAYLNLRKPMDSYPVLGDVPGAVAALQALRRA